MAAAQRRRDSFVVFYIVAFVLVAAASAAVWWFWKDKQDRLANEARLRAAQVEAGPTVVTGQAVRGPVVRKINLTGELRPWRATTLYSKVGGYLSKITVDVGDRVRAGQLIAEVQAPELESDYRSSVSELENRDRIAQRTKDLADKGFFSQQARDNADTDVRTARGRVDSLRSLMGYRSLYAPYAGVITGRYVDPGALITNAANNQASSQPVVTVSDSSKLRVSVYAEQVDARFVHPGGETEIVDTANPSQRIKAKISRVAGELDPRTRTLLAEVDFDNRDGAFLPGSFVNVVLSIPQTSYVEVPAQALVVRDRKNYVAVLEADNHIKLTPIEIAGTDGASVKIANGIGEGARVALSLPNTVPDGAKVNPTTPPGAPAPQPAPASPPPAKPAAAPASPQQPR
ncbi:MAG TPA: efflux RND transporter periplasmic adaptor subunit [Burkholderiales bacterium]|nr:efflux RND transporter periplasmic adaptor subunit [Burkholderiales bacterium]